MSISMAVDAISKPMVDDSSVLAPEMASRSDVQVQSKYLIIQHRNRSYTRN